MKHCMLDLETLSTQNDAACIAIGAVAFDADLIFSRFEVLIDPIAAIGHRSSSTLRWWGEQNQEVRSRMFSGKIQPAAAIGSFCEWAQAQKLSVLWGNDPQFDVSILRNLHRSVNGSESGFPFHFRNERSFRTMTWLAKTLKIDYSSAYEGGVAHDALSDAVCQAQAIQLISARLGVQL
jgi:DNA polymerase III epsilon subunit-like protein